MGKTFRYFLTTAAACITLSDGNPDRIGMTRKRVKIST